MQRLVLAVLLCVKLPELAVQRADGVGFAFARRRTEQPAAPCLAHREEHAAPAAFAGIAAVLEFGFFEQIGRQAAQPEKLPRWPVAVFFVRLAAFLKAGHYVQQGNGFGACAAAVLPVADDGERLVPVGIGPLLAAFRADQPFNVIVGFFSLFRPIAAAFQGVEDFFAEVVLIRCCHLLLIPVEGSEHHSRRETLAGRDDERKTAGFFSLRKGLRFIIIITEL